MPYTFTLLAKQAVKSGLSPDDLLEWQRRGPNFLSDASFNFRSSLALIGSLSSGGRMVLIIFPVLLLC